MKILMIFLSLAFLLSSCSSSGDAQKKEAKEGGGNETQSQEILADVKDHSSKMPQLVDIVANMAEQLDAEFPEKKRNENILITTIVDLDDYKKTDKLGRLLSEQFIHQLHIRKFHIIDYKVPGVIQILASGDFALTRDIKKLKKHVKADRLLVGTMSKTPIGTQINVRILNVKQDHVEATASALIPNSLLATKQNKQKTRQYLVRNSKAANETVSVE